MLILGLFLLGCWDVNVVACADDLVWTFGGFFNLGSEIE
jgi:hypothetical protein